MSTKRQRIFIDQIGMLFSMTPIVLSIYIGILALSRTNYIFLKIIIFLNFYIGSYFVILFILRLLIPKLKPGVYQIGLNKGFMTWVLHLSLSRSLKIANLKELVYSTRVLRSFFFKALGSKIDFDTTLAINCDISDLQLITIKQGTLIADNVKINAHLISNGKLFLSPVTIGENCFISEDSKINARVTISDNSIIERSTHLANKKI